MKTLAGRVRIDPGVKALPGTEGPREEPRPKPLGGAAHTEPTPELGPVINRLSRSRHAASVQWRDFAGTRVLSDLVVTLSTLSEGVSEGQMRREEVG